MTLSWGALSDKLITQARGKRVPIIGQFELTPRCNLHCKMCYICLPMKEKRAILRERTAEEWISLAGQARDAGMLYLLLTGGEVFVRKDFRTIYKEIAGMGFCTQLYTNGTMITPEIAKWLGRNPPFKVGITLYGASAGTYGRVCGNTDGFERAVRGIDLLRAEGIRIDLRTTVVRGNQQDFAGMARIAEDRGLEFGVVNYVTPRRDGEETDPTAERLTVDELTEYEQHVENYFKTHSREQIGQELPGICDELEYRRIESESNKQMMSFPCEAGQASFWMTWDGRMTPCAISDKIAALPFRDGFGIAWEDLQKQCASAKRCSICSQCIYQEYCLACPARLMNETGSFEQPSPYFCNLAQKKWKLLNSKNAL